MLKAGHNRVTTAWGKLGGNKSDFRLTATGRSAILLSQRWRFAEPALIPWRVLLGFFILTAGHRAKIGGEIQVSKFDNTKVIAHLQKKWGSKACPMCDKGPWNVQDSTYQFAEYNEGSLVVGGPVIPVVPVICGNCGHTILINAIVAGVIQISGVPEKMGMK